MGEELRGVRDCEKVVGSVNWKTSWDTNISSEKQRRAGRMGTKNLTVGYLTSRFQRWFSHC